MKYLLSFIYFFAQFINAGYFSAEATTHGGSKISLPKSVEFFSERPIFDEELGYLLTQPVEMLEENLNMQINLVKTVQALNTILQTPEKKEGEHLDFLICVLDKIINCYKEKPLSLLSECSTDGSTCCPLMRKKDQTICPRSQFEKELLEALQEKEKLNIIFYASGSFFFELKLALSLHQPIESIVFIDPVYKESIDYLINNNITTLDKDAFIKMPRERWLWLYLFAQVTQAIAIKHPETSIYFYKNNQDYLNDFLHEKRAKTNLISAIDYQEDFINIKLNLELELSALERNTLEDEGIVATSFMYGGNKIFRDIRYKE